MIQYVQWTGLFLMFILLLHFLAEEKMQLEATKNYIVEYLENVCAHRYVKLNRAEQKATEEVNENAIEEEEPEAREIVDAQVKEEQQKNEREMRIRAILEEFLA